MVVLIPVSLSYCPRVKERRSQISTNLIYRELWNSRKLASSGYGARFVMLTASRILGDNLVWDPYYKEFLSAKRMEGHMDRIHQQKKLLSVQYGERCHASSCDQEEGCMC